MYMYVCVPPPLAVEKKLTCKNVSSPAFPSGSCDSQLAVSIRTGVASGIVQSVLHLCIPERFALSPVAGKKNISA